MEELVRPCCIRGYHVYKENWTPVIGETLTCKREPSNAYDKYAVAVIKNERVVGHLPRKISNICSHFLEDEGTIHCVVTGEPQNSLDHFDADVPCNLILTAEVHQINHMKNSLLGELNYMCMCMYIIMHLSF